MSWIDRLSCGRKLQYVFIISTITRLTGFWGAEFRSHSVLAGTQRAAPQRDNDNDDNDNDSEENVCIALTTPRSRNIALAPAFPVVARRSFQSPTSLERLLRGI